MSWKEMTVRSDARPPDGERRDAESIPAQFRLIF
jgi:hypothetical protein